MSEESFEALLDQIFYELKWVKDKKTRERYKKRMYCILESRMTAQEKELALLALLNCVEDHVV